MNTSTPPRSAGEQAHTSIDALSSETQLLASPPVNRLAIHASNPISSSLPDTHSLPVVSQQQYHHQNTGSEHAALDRALPPAGNVADYDHDTSMTHDTFEDESVPTGEKKSMKRLTRDQRRDILLMRRLGHKYEEISRFLGVSQSAVQYTVNSQRASPEHHKAGRKKTVRTEAPRHARGRKVRKDADKSKSDEVPAETTSDTIRPAVMPAMERGVTSLSPAYPGNAESPALLLGITSQDELF